MPITNMSGRKRRYSVRLLALESGDPGYKLGWWYAIEQVEDDQPWMHVRTKKRADQLLRLHGLAAVTDEQMEALRQFPKEH